MSQSGVPAGGELHQPSEGTFYHDVFEFHVDAAKRLVVVKFGKRVTADEIASYAKELRFHPAFEPSFAEIADLRETEELDLQADDFLRLADHEDPFSQKAKRAFVVRTSVQNHAARMHKILCGQRNMAIFPSLEEAEDWVRS